MRDHVLLVRTAIDLECTKGEYIEVHTRQFMLLYGEPKRKLKTPIRIQATPVYFSTNYSIVGLRF